MKFGAEIVTQIFITLIIGVAVTFLGTKSNTEVNTVKISDVYREIDLLRDRVSLMEQCLFERGD